MLAALLLAVTAGFTTQVVDPAPRSVDPPVGLRLRADPVVTFVGGASVGFDLLPRDWNSRLSVAAFVVDVPRFLVGFVVPTAEHRSS